MNYCSDMSAVILAGGFGTRLKGVIKDVPKPMASLAGRPFLEYLILQLAKWDIRNIILSLGYKGSVIKSYFGDGKDLGVKIIYSDENIPLGTGGAVKKAAQLFDDEKFIVMNGDSFLVLNFNEMIANHLGRKAAVSIAMVYVSDTSRYGKVEINDEGEVIRFNEKRQRGDGFINGGVYVFNREVVKNLPDGNLSLECDVLPSLISHGLYGVATNGFFIDIGMPEDYFYLVKNIKILLGAISVQMACSLK